MDDVLIVGAGPTGLMLAVWLAASGIKARVVDGKPGPTEETRAVTLQARTLEFWQMLGIADRALALGRRAEATSVWVDNRVVARLPLGEIGRDLSPFPFVLLLPQSETERILYERLRELGADVEWNTELKGISDFGLPIFEVETPQPDPQPLTRPRFILGCDGASSVVRKSVGLDFPGGTYSGKFFVADVTAKDGVVPGEVNIAFLRDRFFAFFPLKEPDRYRIAGLLRKEEPTEADMRQEVEGGMRTSIESVRWFSIYRVHHRVVERFRQGPVFLLGDAAHVHSPVGGQGMNTGLGDAVNLAWKLVEVLKHGADERLLGTYEAERRPFALSLVATTDRAFEVAVSPKPLARFVRTRLLPLALPLALRFRPFRRLAFLTVSQTRISYRKGPLAGSSVGSFRGGDRLPPSVGILDRNVGWRLVVYGRVPQRAADWCAANGVELCPVPGAGSVVLVLLVRPDGYIGVALPSFSAASLDRYLRETISRRAQEMERTQSSQREE